MSNLKIYDAVRAVPKEAQKAISGGRLNGKTDINPMWRLKTLTEQFGPCGVGWKYTIERQWLEAHGEETAAFVNILLYFKEEGEWSEGIPGTGGSMFAAKERSGIYVSDECFKMALTDAISVACKALGFGADIYWAKDRSKYDTPPQSAPLRTQEQMDKILALGRDKGITQAAIAKVAIKEFRHGLDDLTHLEAEALLTRLGKAAPKEAS